MSKLYKLEDEGVRGVLVLRVPASDTYYVGGRGKPYDAALEGQQIIPSECSIVKEVRSKTDLVVFACAYQHTCTSACSHYQLTLDNIFAQYLTSAHQHTSFH